MVKSGPWMDQRETPFSLGKRGTGYLVLKIQSASFLKGMDAERCVGAMG